MFLSSNPSSGDINSSNLSCVSHAFVSVHYCLMVTCLERADLLALVGVVYCIFVTFPCGNPGSGVVLDCIVS